MQGFIKHLFVSMSVTQNLSVSVFVHKCLMMLNDVEYTTFKMFVTQMSNYLLREGGVTGYGRWEVGQRKPSGGGRF